MESLEGIVPQLYVDNLKCSSCGLVALLASAHQSGAHVEAVVQEADPTTCVLLSTPKTARKRMTEWRNANAGCLAAVRLDVRDLGGHSDVTQRASAGTLGTKVK